MKKDDSVFQVSLTEIAFTLVLLMLLLLGYRLTQSLKELSEQKAIVTEQKTVIEKQQADLEQFKTLSSQFGGLCRPDPEDPIEPMMPCIKCLSVAGKMSKDEAQKSVELGQFLTQTWKNNSSLKSYEEFRREIADAAGKLAEGHKLVMEEEKQKLLDLADQAVKLQQQLEASNRELTTQNAYFKRRIGMDDPPCWITAENYKPQYIFSVLIRPDSSYVVTPNWPKEREKEALSIPGVKAMVAQKYLNREDFNRFSQLILDYAQAQKPQACRFFVTMRNQIPDRRTADLARLNLENFFYKYEIVQ